MRVHRSVRVLIGTCLFGSVSLSGSEFLAADVTSVPPPSVHSMAVNSEESPGSLGNGEGVQDGRDHVVSWDGDGSTLFGGDVSVYDVAPCGGGGGVTLDDILAMLSAFGGSYACNCPGGGGGQWSTNGTHIYNANTGNVGIGTSTPGWSLHVVGNNVGMEEYQGTPGFYGRRANGTMAAPTAVVDGSILAEFGAFGFDGSAFAGSRAGIRLAAAENWTATNHGTEIRFLTSVSGSDAYTEKMRIDDQGVLRLYNDTAGETMSLDSADASNSAYITLRMWDGAALRDTVNIESEEGGGGGQIILRNEAASQRVQIDGDGTNDEGFIQLFNGLAQEGVLISGGDAANAASITLNMMQGATLRETVAIEAEEGGGGAQIILRNDSGSQRVQIDADGTQDEGFITVYNGAGVASITLDGEDTSGNGRIITQILEITGGSDLSEQFDLSPGAAKAEPGMVVCIDPANPGRLTVCTASYDRTVAGIISGAGGVRPGMMMGQKDTVANGEHPVALTGRVYVWADATFGPIQPGDLLTTSATPGHAMKANDLAKAQGAIIGKAMTSLDSEMGLVLVIVTLQ